MSCYAMLCYAILSYVILTEIYKKLSIGWVFFIMKNELKESD